MDIGFRDDGAPSDRRARRSAPRRGWLGPLAVGLAIIAIVVASVIFARADQERRVAEAHLSLHTLDELALTVVQLRATGAVTVVVLSAADAGVNVADAPDEAAASLRSHAAQLASWTPYASEDLSPPSLDRITASVRRLSVAAENLADAAERRDATAAIRTSEVMLLSTSTSILDTIASERSRIEALIEAERSTAGDLARATSFAVAFLLPLLALFGFRSVVRRRQRSAELQAELDKQRALARAKDEMIGNLSHELRTPLTGIYGFALAMEDSGFEDPAFAAEMTRIIVSESADLTRMVDDLLAAAKASGDGLAYHLGPVDVGREVDEVLVPFRHQGATIDVAIEPAAVQADRLRLRQVVRNLVSNAVKHGGPNVLVYGAKVADERYRLAVLDDGPGVPTEIEPRLFQRFLHEGESPLTTGSVGLGLAIASMMTHDMGGELTYRRDDGTTAFVVDLPLASPDADAAAAREGATQGAA